MIRAALVGLAVLSLGLACTEKGRSVVLVEVRAGSVVGVDSVFVHITQPGQPSHHAEGTGPPPWKLGVYLPKSVSGLVNVEVCAFASASTGTHEVIQAANMPKMVLVAPGETVGPEVVVLETGTPFAVCGGMGGQGGSGGAGGSGGGGVSGAAGTGGVAGSIGGASGAGGSVGGAGGLAGGGGRGGLAGGLAGGGGRGGTTGTAGMGGAGRGGTTGAAGMGGSGMAGGPDWRGPKEVQALAAVDEKNPSVAVDLNGKAVVVFEHNSEIWTSCYDPGVTQPAWSGPIAISTGGPYQAPAVAVDGTGRFTAVWAHGPGATNTGVWQRVSLNCLGWEPVSQLTGSNAGKPVIAVNSDGAAIVAWSERLPTLYQQATASVRRMPTGVNWSTPMPMLISDNDASDRFPAVGMTNVGEAFVVWVQVGGTSGLDSIWYQKTDPVGAWMPTAMPFETYEGGRAYAPAIAINGNNAIVTYLQRAANTTQLFARRYNGSTASLQAALPVAEASEIDSYVPPSVTLDGVGTATVAFGMLDLGGKYNVNISRAKVTDTMWPPVPLAMEMDDTAAEDGMVFGAAARATLPVVRSDGAGNVVLVWRKRVGPPVPIRFDLYARRLAGGVWSPEKGIETIDVSNAAVASVFSPVLGINGSGVAVAAWYYGGVNVPIDVYANVWR